MQDIKSVRAIFTKNGKQRQMFLILFCRTNNFRVCCGANWWIKLNV